MNASNETVIFLASLPFPEKHASITKVWNNKIS